MTGRVLVLGLDGADREALLDGMNDGSLPTLAGIAEAGGIGLLRAPLPPLTPVSMASMLTGTDPEDHGIRCFEQDGDYVDRTDIQAPTLFEELDREIISINVPMTSPPPQEGTVVVGFPRADRQLASDPALEHRLQRMDYRVEPDRIESEDFEDSVFDCTRKRFDAAEELIRNDWELFMLMVTGDARLQHFSNDHETTKRLYELVDERLGALLEEVDDDVTVIVFSDHGFVDHHATLNIEQWLIEAGHLTATERATEDRLYGRNSGSYDLEASTAVPMGAYMAPLRVLDTGRTQELRDELLAIEDPETGEQVFREVVVRDDGRELVPVPRRGYSHRCWDGALFDHDPEEQRVPDPEGVIMTDRPGLLRDGDTESSDILPMLRELLQDDA